MKIVPYKSQTAAHTFGNHQRRLKLTPAPRRPQAQWVCYNATIEGSPLEWSARSVDRIMTAKNI